MTEPRTDQASEKSKEPPHGVKVCWCYAIDCEYCFAAHYCDHSTAECRWCKSDKDQSIPVEQKDRCVCEEKNRSATAIGDSSEGDVTRLPEKGDNSSIKGGSKTTNREEPSPKD